ncbi:hypothetical protein [Haematobacter sp. UBA3484]|uniref:hypothetical protein n=1 Tax=Haematobacter sp. UBA3484 TaxID=1946582 RepID=UPI0025BDF5E5|nr:hypothetical protein [Haematobacter sp. UBA3484]
MENSSGFRPVEFNVLIKQDKVEEKTKGGLLLSTDVQEREKYSATRGVIVAVSPMAFAFDDWPGGEPKPKPGDAVVFARHAGVFVTGLDDEEYRVIKDKDVVAVMEAK